MPVAPSTGEAPETGGHEQTGEATFKHPPPAVQSTTDGATGMTPARQLSSFPPAVPKDWSAYTGGAVPPPPPGPWPGQAAGGSGDREHSRLRRRAAMASDARSLLQFPPQPMLERDARRPESPPAQMRTWWFPGVVELRAWEAQFDNPVETFRYRNQSSPELAYCFVRDLPDGTPHQPLSGGLPDELRFVGWCAMPCPHPHNSGTCFGRCYRPVYSGSRRCHPEHVCSGCRGFGNRR